MRRRWHFTFKGRGYKHFDCDASQVRCVDPIEAIRNGWVEVHTVEGRRRVINMSVVAFIDIIEHPDQPGLARAAPDETT